MLCSHGIELIKDLERTSEDTLPPYKVIIFVASCSISKFIRLSHKFCSLQTDTVRLTLNEMRNLFNQNVETM